MDNYKKIMTEVIVLKNIIYLTSHVPLGTSWQEKGYGNQIWTIFNKTKNLVKCSIKQTSNIQTTKV